MGLEVQKNLDLLMLSEAEGVSLYRVAIQIYIEFFRGFQGFFREDLRIFQGSFWTTVSYLLCLVLMIEKWQTFQLKPANQLHNI